jgi:large subunit ribosomal protein L29
MSKTTVTLEELRDQPDDELRAALARTRDDLFRLQLGQYTNQVTSTAGLTTKRRDIARIMTILRARALGNEKQAQKTETKAEAASEAPAEGKKSKAKSTKKAKS